MARSTLHWTTGQYLSNLLKLLNIQCQIHHSIAEIPAKQVAQPNPEIDGRRNQ